MKNMSHAPLLHNATCCYCLVGKHLKPGMRDRAIDSGRVVVTECLLRERIQFQCPYALGYNNKRRFVVLLHFSKALIMLLYVDVHKCVTSDLAITAFKSKAGLDSVAVPAL